MKYNRVPQKAWTILVNRCSIMFNKVQIQVKLLLPRAKIQILYSSLGSVQFPFSPFSCKWKICDAKTSTVYTTHPGKQRPKEDLPGKPKVNWVSSLYGEAVRERSLEKQRHLEHHSYQANLPGMREGRFTL